MRSMVEGAAPPVVTSRVLALTVDVGSAPSVTLRVTAPRQAGSKVSRARFRGLCRLTGEGGEGAERFDLSGC